MVRERESAQDLAQETFLQASLGRLDLPQIHNQRAWLYRVATNLALNALKRQRRFAWLPWVETPARVGDIVEQVGAQEALDALSPDYRAPLLLTRIMA